MEEFAKFIQVAITGRGEESPPTLVAVDEEGKVWHYIWPKEDETKPGWHALLTSRYDGGVKL